MNYPIQPKKKVIIADDHQLFNDGIRLLLADDFDIVAQVYDGNEVLTTIHLTRPDIVLLDINLPKLNGFEIAKQIKHSFEWLKIIFLTMYNEGKFIEQSKLIPVDGYMLKHSTKEELITCIDAVIAGDFYYDSKLNLAKPNLHHDDYFVKQFSLSSREVEVIRCIKLGLSSKEISEKLFLSEETIKSHRKNIHFKLKIKNIAELIEFAVQNGI